MRRVSDFPPGHFAGWMPRDIVDALGWRAVRDPAEIEEHCRAVVREFPDQAASFRSGRKAVAGFLVSKVMDRTFGGADPALTRAALERILSR